VLTASRLTRKNWYGLQSWDAGRWAFTRSANTKDVPGIDASTRGRPLAPASVNRSIELLRHMMNWSVGREYLDRTPFRRGSETLIRKQHEDNQLRRRLAEDEEAKLLSAAGTRSPYQARVDDGAGASGFEHAAWSIAAASERSEG
jgi:hypothetical protein